MPSIGERELPALLPAAGAVAGPPRTSVPLKRRRERGEGGARAGRLRESSALSSTPPSLLHAPDCHAAPPLSARLPTFPPARGTGAGPREPFRGCRRTPGCLRAARVSAPPRRPRSGSVEAGGRGPRGAPVGRAALLLLTSVSLRAEPRGVGPPPPPGGRRPPRTTTSDQTRRPAEFKHITKRRKRN